jgi:hypothetical protein
MRIVLLAWLSIPVVISGCQGIIEDDPASARSDPRRASGSGDACVSVGERTIAPTVVRRLTRAEYRNTVADLFDVEPPPAELLPDDMRIDGFRTTAGQPISEATASKYIDAAAAVRAAIDDDVAGLFGCGAEAELTCVQRFLDTEGTRIFRRPLRPDERAHYESVFAALGAELSFDESALTMIEAMLVSPQFLFLVEERPASIAEGDAFPLDDWQLASRLSYALWQTTPDAPLLEAASDGTLTEDAAFREHAARLASDPRIDRALRAFYTDWLGLDALALLTVSSEEGGTAELVAALEEETRRYVEHAFSSGEDDTLASLYLSPVRFRSATLSAFYGDALSTSPSVERVSGPIEDRSFGLLSLAGFLVTRSANPDTAIIHRGRFVRERLLCQPLGSPPPGVAGSLPALRPDMTRRQRIETHTGAETCQTCHSLINGPGFALETFDPRGHFSLVDNARPVDARAEIVGTDVGAVDGARELSERLASSADARHCAVQRLYQFALGRALTRDDTVWVDALAATDERNFVQLFLALTDEDVFHVRREYEVAP